MFRGTRGGVGWGVAEGAGGIEINRTPGLVFENRSARFMQTMFLYEQKKKKKKYKLLGAKFLCLTPVCPSKCSQHDEERFLITLLETSKGERILSIPCSMQNHQISFQARNSARLGRTSFAESEKLITAAGTFSESRSSRARHVKNSLAFIMTKNKS